jgi:hypothetical protein
MGLERLGSHPMRPPRWTILLLAGLVALHVYMLAGHGRAHARPMGGPHAVAEDAGSPTRPWLSAPIPAEQDTAGMDMTVACLAVLAGLLLLLPVGSRRLATARPARRRAIDAPDHSDRAGPRTRSPTQLCISLM